MRTAVRFFEVRFWFEGGSDEVDGSLLGGAWKGLVGNELVLESIWCMMGSLNFCSLFDFLV
jgi:hypothetical protein